MKKLGVLVGETRPLSAVMVSKTAPRVGQYVFIRYQDAGALSTCLALVQRIWRANPFLEEGLTDPEHALRIMEMEKWDSFFRAELSIVGQVAGARLSFPKSPPLPGAEVTEADPASLKQVLGAEDETRWARVGTLLGSDVPVYLDIDQLVLRHLAVLAVTGGGKSNAMGVILGELARRGGTAIVLDPHGEYGQMGKNISPVLNPMRMTTGEMAGFLGVDMDRASIQYYLLYLARREMEAEQRRTNVKPGGGDEFDRAVGASFDYLAELSERLVGLSETRVENPETLDEKMLEELRKKQDSLTGLLIRIENLRNDLGHIFRNEARPLVECIEEGKINSVDLSGLDQPAADTVAAHLLRHILAERKRAMAGETSCLRAPVFVVIEEAHLFCPDGASTSTRYHASRIAREGRKFGVGLAIISQRPKRLDPDVLSQMNNMIILRIVEPGDQRHISEASENLSGDLVSYLPSLNPGEAVCIGPAFRVPLLVRIDEAKKKPAGRDLPVTGAWKERPRLMTEEEARGIYG